MVVEIRQWDEWEVMVALMLVMKVKTLEWLPMVADGYYLDSVGSSGTRLIDIISGE